MEEQNIPRRRKPRQKSKFEIFREEKLPLVIAVAAALLILIFIIGSISNAVQRNRIEKERQVAAAQQAQQEKSELDAQVAALLQQAQLAAQQYDYDGALALLEPVSKHAAKYTELNQAIEDYEAAKEELICWDDPAQVPNLSFQMLVADPALAFQDEQYGSAFNRNYVTTAEFSAILMQLYENGYVLVNLDDVYSSQATEDGASAYYADSIYLPEGKKPLIITQTNVNYDAYLIDSNKDGDLRDGRGFASKLMIQDGKPVNEMVDKNGNTLVGEYDLIPILESFVAAHPDFSYKGAKAIIAVTGHEGLFGYRTNSTDDYDEISRAAETAQWLRKNGYELACYTYGNRAYGNMTASEIRSDLQQWNSEVTAILGETDILVFAQRSDIASTGSYAGASFEIVMQYGFRYYLGFCDNGEPWSRATTQYVRQGRIMVTGATLYHHSEWFTELFDASAVLDASRGTIPSW